MTRWEKLVKAGQIFAATAPPVLLMATQARRIFLWQISVDPGAWGQLFAVATALGYDITYIINGVIMVLFARKLTTRAKWAIMTTEVVAVAFSLATTGASYWPDLDAHFSAFLHIGPPLVGICYMTSLAFAYSSFVEEKNPQLLQETTAQFHLEIEEALQALNASWREKLEKERIVHREELSRVGEAYARLAEILDEVTIRMNRLEVSAAGRGATTQPGEVINKNTAASRARREKLRAEREALNKQPVSMVGRG